MTLTAWYSPITIVAFTCKAVLEVVWDTDTFVAARAQVAGLAHTLQRIQQRSWQTTLEPSRLLLAHFSNLIIHLTEKEHCHQHDDDFFYVVANQGSKQQKQELQQLKTNF